MDLLINNFPFPFNPPKIFRLNHINPTFQDYHIFMKSSYIYIIFIYHFIIGIKLISIAGLY